MQSNISLLVERAEKWRCGAHFGVRGTAASNICHKIQFEAPLTHERKNVHCGAIETTEVLTQ